MCSSNIYNLTKVDANRLLNIKGKRIWVELHNRSANLYYLSSDGKICDVSPSGWWY